MAADVMPVQKPLKTMKAGTLLISLLVVASSLFAQKDCSSYVYAQERMRAVPGLATVQGRLEEFIGVQSGPDPSARLTGSVIRIPVVVHILYNSPAENISDAQVSAQIAVLNDCFRKTNADTSKIPAWFRPLAADCGIEFVLATADPRKRATSGIVRKYTPVKFWQPNDKMKFSAELGDDAWDARQYLNIWVCNVERVAGYASVPGDDPLRDGLVIRTSVFGKNTGVAGYDMGKTAVHEAGHWLGLKHIWGDTYCGDDGVADTPKQAGFNVNCPSASRVTCGNGPYGDMFMNYMDLTSDACMSLFTNGQRDRMLALFRSGGPRNSLLGSSGLNPPLVQEVALPPLPDPIKPQSARLFPNPASDLLQLDLSYDASWAGQTLRVVDLQGQVSQTVVIRDRIQRIDISRLRAGVYVLIAMKSGGETIQFRFVKF
ncbi:MAG: hypothetical protein RJA57_431 [Bacteroidota bacterium]|jgi:hypothetical protein